MSHLFKKPFVYFIDSRLRHSTSFNYSDFLLRLGYNLFQIEYQQCFVSHLTIGQVHFGEHQEDFRLG